MKRSMEEATPKTTLILTPEFMKNLNPKTSFLFGAKEENFPHINQATKTQAAKNPGTVVQFLEKKGTDVQLFDYQLKNKVKVCELCKKCNGFTLMECNGCGAQMKNTKISFSDNIFTCFLYGIEKGPFNYTVSVRYEDEEILVFDDLLRLTPCHYNAIPASVFIPDWRYLLRNPTEGLRILKLMKDKVFQVAREQYLSNKEWKEKIFLNGSQLSDEEILSCFCFGCNYPPSQFQLHLQSILPPYCPYRWLLHMNGGTSMYERFFSLEYIEEVLKCNLEMNVSDDSPSIRDIIDTFSARGVIYDDYFHKILKEITEGHEKLANWKHQDFEFIKIDDVVYSIGENNELTVREMTPDQVREIANNKDLSTLTNYGRPFINHKFTGGYYSFSKDEPLASFYEKKEEINNEENFKNNSSVIVSKI